MKMQSYAFNMDTGCVEMLFTGGTMIAIDCTAVERAMAENMTQRSELDWLIDNDPLEYVECPKPTGLPKAFTKGGRIRFGARIHIVKSSTRIQIHPHTIGH